MDSDKRAKIIERVRALRAKTVENGATEAEARTAASMVDKLLGEYDLTLSETDVKRFTCEKLAIPVPGGRLDSPIMRAVVNMAKFCDVKVWYDENLPKLSVIAFGFPVDLEVYEYLFYVLQRAIERETGGFTLLNFEYQQMSKAAQRVAQDSFAIGIADRVGERLAEMRTHRDEWVQKSTGTSLVIVKGAQVASEFEKLGMKLSKGRKLSGPRDHMAFQRGRSAGDSVQITRGVHGYSDAKKLTA